MAPNGLRSLPGPVWPKATKMADMHVWLGGRGAAFALRAAARPFLLKNRIPFPLGGLTPQRSRIRRSRELCRSEQFAHKKTNISFRIIIIVKSRKSLFSLLPGPLAAGSGCLVSGRRSRRHLLHGVSLHAVSLSTRSFCPVRVSPGGHGSASQHSCPPRVHAC